MGKVHLVLANTPISVASEIFRKNRGRALVVDTGDDSPSIFTEFDVVKMVAAGESPGGKTVADFHTRTVVAAKPSWSLERALHTMMVGQFRHLIVVDNAELVGMLAMRDILDMVVEHAEEPVAAAVDETVEIAAIVPDDSARLLHNLRRSAKQHWVSIKCDCELDWIEVVIGQAEERTDLDAQELQELWDQRPLCPTLNSMGGGGD
jgi:signal-transduction protein with cAMP-binding, CBS, and nucleotidyltransferase domain